MTTTPIPPGVTAAGTDIDTPHPCLLFGTFAPLHPPTTVPAGPTATTTSPGVHRATATVNILVTYHFLHAARIIPTATRGPPDPAAQRDGTLIVVIGPHPTVTMSVTLLTTQADTGPPLHVQVVIDKDNMTKTSM